MPLLPLVIENGLTVRGNSTVTGSVTISAPLTNVQASGSFTGSFQGNGTNITGAKAIISNMPSGTVIQLYEDQTEDIGTTNTTVKSYTLAANIYSTIIIETETEFRNNANTNGIVTFNIVVGGVNKRAHNIESDATGPGDQQTMGRTLKYSEAITGGDTITITTTGTTGGTWTVNSLRVYGVL
jgi:hypothetical protein